MYPETLKYTKDHEWIRVSGDTLLSVIATTPIRKPARTSETAMSRGTPASCARNCTPSSRKIAALRTKMTRSQTDRFWSLERGAPAIEKSRRK